MRDIKYRDEGRPEDLLQELGYETQDIAYKKFTVYGAYFFGFFIFCIIAGFFIMLWMSPTGLSGGRMSDSTPRIEAPKGTPLLQSNITARTDIRDLRMDETKQLTTSGVNQGKGTYHIPIDKAIDEVANASDAERAKMGLPRSGGQSAAQPIAAESHAASGAQNVSKDTSPFVTGPEGGHGG